MACGWFKLARLSLADNGISELGAEALAEGLRSPSAGLEVLDLGSNAVGDPGAVALGQTLRLCANLRVLKLDGCRIRDPGARAIAGSLHHARGLELVELRGQKLGWQGREAIAQLRGVRPGSEVLFDTDAGDLGDYADGSPMPAPAPPGPRSPDQRRSRSRASLDNAALRLHGADAGAEDDDAGQGLRAGASERRRRSLGWDSVGRPPAQGPVPVFTLPAHLRNLGEKEAGLRAGAAPDGADGAGAEGGAGSVPGDPAPGPGGGGAGEGESRHEPSTSAMELVTLEAAGGRTGGGDSPSPRSPASPPAAPGSGGSPPRRLSYAAALVGGGPRKE